MTDPGDRVGLDLRATIARIDRDIAELARRRKQPDTSMVKVAAGAALATGALLKFDDILRLLGAG